MVQPWPIRFQGKPPRAGLPKLECVQELLGILVRCGGTRVMLLGCGHTLSDKVLRSFWEGFSSPVESDTRKEKLSSLVLLGKQLQL